MDQVIQAWSFPQTINVNLKDGKLRGTTSLPGTGLAKRYDLPGLDALQILTCPVQTQERYVVILARPGHVVKLSVSTQLYSNGLPQ